MKKSIKTLLVSVMITVTFFGTNIAQQAWPEQAPVKDFERGVDAINDIVKAREALKQALDELSEESSDVKRMREQLERIISQINVVFPQGDEDLQGRIELVLARICHLEKTKEHIEKNYWQISKPLVALCVVGAIGATVGGWCLLRWFMKREEAVFKKEKKNALELATRAAIARRLAGNQQQQ